MTGMRIKSHKNAFGTHNGTTIQNHWNPNAPRTFWEGLQPVTTAKTAAVAVAVTAKKAKTKTKKSKTKARK